MTAGAAELTLALTPWASIAGTAVDSAGHPVVSARGVLEDRRGDYREAYSDSAGHFAFSQVTSGDCVVVLFSRMGEPRRMQVTPRAGEHVELGSVRLVGL